MTDACILPVKPGVVSKADRARLSRVGVVVIEVDEPESIRLIAPHADVSRSDMLMAAMKAMMGASSGPERAAFAVNLYERMLKSEQDGR